MLDLAKKLISIPSTSDSKENLHKVLEVACEPLKGFYIKSFLKDGIPSVIVSNTNGNPDKFKIILNGHLDVVPGKPEQFKPAESAGKLYGRGACDMKSQAAVLITVFSELAKKVNYPLGLQLVTDEEIGGFNGTKYQLEQRIRADFVLAGDSYHTTISHQAKGILWLDVTASGKSAHGAYPWEGKNAILKIGKFIKLLKQEFPTPKKEAWVTTVNVAKINSPNTAYNKVPDSCTVGLDIRYIPADADTILQKTNHLISNDLRPQIITHEPHQYTDPNNPYIQALLKLDPKLKLVSDHGASDIRHFQTYDIPGCLIGPEGSGLHSDQEWVDINSLKQFSALLNNFLSNI